MTNGFEAWDFFSELDMICEQEWCSEVGGLCEETPRFTQQKTRRSEAHAIFRLYNLDDSMILPLIGVELWNFPPRVADMSWNIQVSKSKKSIEDSIELKPLFHICVPKYSDKTSDNLVASSKHSLLFFIFDHAIPFQSTLGVPFFKCDWQWLACFSPNGESNHQAHFSEVAWIQIWVLD